MYPARQCLSLEQNAIGPQGTKITVGKDKSFGIRDVRGAAATCPDGPCTSSEMANE